MRYHALAADFDGTLAHEGIVDAATIDAIGELRESGRKAIMVTGRIVPSLTEAFRRLDLFDLVVAENGAVLYEPSTKTLTPLVAAPPPEYAQTLAKLGVAPLEIGEVIVATWEPNETIVMDTIRTLGLELQIIFNKGAVMTLPSGVNKASGLERALERLGLSPRNAAAVGDAENDHAMMHLCELSAAVANALPSVKEHADVALSGDHGEGVRQLIGALVATDAQEIVPQPRDGAVVLGRSDRETIVLPAYMSGTLLIAGASGGGKSTVTTGILERLTDRGYQLCVIDPEGDYDSAAFAVSIGDPKHVPALDEIEALLAKPAQSVSVNLLGLPLDARPQYFADLVARLTAMRANSGRPHWTVLEEAHHVAPRERDVHFALPAHNVIAVTVNPERLSPLLLRTVTSAIALGETAQDVIGSLDSGARVTRPPKGSAVLWHRAKGANGTVFEVAPPREALQRHRRKYAMGDLAPEKSFYFRGKSGKLNLRAQNLSTFAQLAEGVDEETWLHHLRNGDVERWFREMIGDRDLAEAARQARGKDAQHSRRAIVGEIHTRYTAPT